MTAPDTPRATSAAEEPTDGPRGRRRAFTVPVLSALAAVVVHCLGVALAGRFPFGPHGRDIADLGAQFVPFHALFARALRGEDPTTTATFTWAVGNGTPFIGDYATYLASPFALIAVPFGPEHASMALFVIACAKLAAGAAMMAFFLLSVMPPRSSAFLPWWAGLLGLSWATCGWAIDDGTWLPMWLDVLWCLPLLLLVVEQVLRGRRLVLGCVAVALVWWSNYYMAYMASIFATLYLVARLVELRPTGREVLRRLGGFLLRAALGAALAAVLLVPAFLAVGNATPWDEGAFVRKPWSLVVGRFLPMTAGAFAAPGLFIGVAALLAAAVQPLGRHISWTQRLLWPAGALALLLSLQLPATQLAWHAFALPHGGTFREAFVVCAWLILMAWRSMGAPWTRLQTGIALGAGLALLAVSRIGTAATVVPVDGVLVVAVSVLVLGIAAGCARRLPRIALAATVAVVVLGSIANVLGMERGKQDWESYPTVAGAAGDSSGSASWPTYRTTAGAQVRANDGAVTGRVGSSYYSSLTPAESATMLAALDLGWTSFGRGTSDPADPVGASLMGAERLQARYPEVAVYPLVRTVPSALQTPSDGRPGGTDGAADPSGDDAMAIADGSAFASRRNAVAGAEVYRAVDTQVRTGSPDGPLLAVPPSGLEVDPGQVYVLTASCRPGDLVQVFSPALSGRVSTADQAATMDGVREEGVVATRAEPATLGVTDDGRVEAQVVPSGASLLADASVACVDLGALRAAVQDAERPTELRIRGGRVEAQWDRPVSGTTVIAVPAYRGWSCTADERATPVRDVSGMLAVRTESVQRLTCRYSPPGLTAGLVVSLSSLTCLVTFGIRSRSRARRSVTVTWGGTIHRGRVPGRGRADSPP
ncbi:YfhO family protein [Brachybacterium sp. AOP25-B2-12]|uniref:YfhO family protein n=1 Tax=Brachybacterium sp. AOP25-B2-12 TaxID=3457710 RepID=UPI0040336116